MASERKSKPAWEDRFHRPALGDLLAELPRPAAQLASCARAALVAEGAREALAWHGIPWRWSLRYDHASDPARPIAFLVPDPRRLTLVVTVPAGIILDSALLRKSSRFVRDGVLNAPEVDTVRWCTWEVASRSACDEIAALAHATLPSGHPAGSQPVLRR